MHKKFSSGFTLIELMVSVAIIGLLMAAGLVSYQNASVSSRNNKRKADMEQLKAALVLYRTDNNKYPANASGNTSMSAGGVPYPALTIYLSGQNPADPKNSGNYVYTYATDTKKFNLCANLEPTPTAYCVTNP